MIKATTNQLALLNKICEELKVSFMDLEERKFVDVVNAKRVCYYCLRLCGYSTVQIGYIMNKDHSTVLNGLERIRCFPELIDKAEIIFSWFKANFPESVRERTWSGQKMNIEIKNEIKYWLNQNEKNVITIAEKMKQPYELVKREVEYIINFGKKKKIPNYKDGTTKEIFL